MSDSIDAGRRAFCALLPLGLAALARPRPARGEQGAEFFRGREIRFIVGSGPGGGYDAYARMLAPHLAAALAASVLVENRPGAGGLLALNQLYAAEPTGLEVMIVNGAGAALGQLLEQEGARFDLRRLEWLGGIGAEQPIIMLSERSPFRTLAEAKAADRPVRWSASGRNSIQGMWSALATHALAIPSTLIVGYKGSSESALAAMRGEVDGIMVTATSARVYAQEGKLLPVATLGRARSPAFPDTPTVFELFEIGPEAAWWIDLCLRLTETARTLATAPGVPADRAAALAAAFERILTDPAVLAEAEAAGRPIGYAPPETVRRQVLALIEGMEPARTEELRRLLSDPAE